MKDRSAYKRRATRIKIQGLAEGRAQESEQTEDAPRETKEFFQILVENTMDMISIHGPDGTIRYISPSVKQVLGYQPEELIGKIADNIVHPDHLEQVKAQVTQVVDTPGITRLVEAQYRHKDGSYRYLQVTLDNMLDDPAVRGIISSAR